jgi:hypothetical protein
MEFLAAGIAGCGIWRMRRPRFLAPERKRQMQIRGIREEATGAIFGTRDEAADAG